MGVNIKVKMDSAALLKLSNTFEKAINQTAEDILDRAKNDQVIPYATGELENSHRIDKSTPGKTAIIADAPYAVRLYNHPEYTFNKDKHVNAQGEWFEPYIRGAKKKVVNEMFRNLLKKLSGGLIK